MSLNFSVLTAEPGLMGSLTTLLIPLLLIGVMYFLMIRPQKKQEKKLREQRDKMKVGDMVVSIGGIIGRVVNIQDSEVTIQSSVAKSMITFRKDAINQVISPEDAAAKEEKKAEKKAE